jgi:uncharacterized protein (TIRG00374 family)
LSKSQKIDALIKLKNIAKSIFYFIFKNNDVRIIRIKTILKVIFSILLILLIIVLIDWRKTVDSIIHIHYQFLVLSIIFFFIAQVLSALRLKKVMEIQKIKIKFFQMLKFTLLGMFTNNFLPGTIGGDVVKAIFLVRQSKDNNIVVISLSIVADRIVGITSMLFLFPLVIFITHSCPPEYMIL